MARSGYVFAAYVTGNALPEVTRAQARKLTHLNIAFGELDEGGGISIEGIRHYMPFVEAIRRYNPKLHILLSTGGGGEFMAALQGSQKTHGSSATRTPQGIEHVVDSCMAIVRNYALDGVDCDWEFPCFSGVLAEREQYTALIAAYRMALDEYARERGRKCWLTAAWPGFGFSGRCLDIEKLMPHMDFVNIMTYDMEDAGISFAEHMENIERYSTNGRMDMTKVPRKPFYASHHSNILPNSGERGRPQAMCADKTLDSYIRGGVPKEKLVVGAAFYSKVFQDVLDGGTRGLNQISPGRSVHGPGYDVLRNAYEVNPDYVKHWDDEAQACWLYNGSAFITYEDPRALKAKCDFVKENGFAGVMYWSHGSDSTGTLFNTIYDSLYF